MKAKSKLTIGVGSQRNGKKQGLRVYGAASGIVGSTDGEQSVALSAPMVTLRKPKGMKKKKNGGVSGSDEARTTKGNFVAIKGHNPMDAANKACQLGKAIGVSFSEDDGEVIKKVREMEERDRRNVSSSGARRGVL